MQVRTKQTHQIGQILAGTFVDRVTAFVRAELRGAPGEATRDEIAALVERARGYGFTLETTIVAFVLAARFLGHDFDERLPGARAILEDTAPEPMRALDLQALTLATLDQSLTEEGPRP